MSEQALAYKHPKKQIPVERTAVTISQMKSEDSWYWEVIAICNTGLFDLISCYLFELGATGIEEIKNDDGRTDIRIFFPASVLDPVNILKEGGVKPIELDEANMKIRSIEKKPIQNWQDSWREFFKPIEIGSGFVIRPPWEAVHSWKKEIVIHPGQGFGTGYHESTHLALRLLEWVLTHRLVHSVIDVGTGSGILAIGSLLLGSTHVTAIDLDREALQEVPENLRLSGFDTSHVSLFQCGPGALKMQSELVMANIEGHILKTLADDLMRLTLPGGYLLLSGILSETEASLLPVFQKRFQLVKSMQMGEWSSLVLQ